MDEELDQLSAHVARILDVSRRLADENERLKAELAASRGARQSMQERMGEARMRVERALSRLPAAADDLQSGQETAQ